jgi:hypothetical protein
MLSVESQTKIAFLGQCHTTGYPGIPGKSTFPQICREVIESRRPGARVQVVLQGYQHPSELPDATSAALRAAPRVVVIEVVGWLAIRGTESVDLSRLPRGVRSTYQRMRHFRQVSQAVAAAVSRAPHAVNTVNATAAKILGSILPRLTRAAMPEYEACLQQAITQVHALPDVCCVVQGPGAPNLTLNSCKLASDAIERYRAVEAMARRVASANDVLYVDRWDSVTPRFFNPGSIRPTPEGHLMWGHLLADQLLNAGIV